MIQIMTKVLKIIENKMTLPWNDSAVFVTPVIFAVVVAGRNVPDDVNPDAVIFCPLQLRRQPLQHLPGVVGVVQQPPEQLAQTHV